MKLAGVLRRAQIPRLMRGLLPLLAVALPLAAAAPSPLLAQDDDQDGSGLIGLTLPLGARAIGQGRAIAAEAGELQALPYNPAALNGLERGAVTYSRFEAADLADINSNYVAGAYRGAWGTVGLQLVHLDLGEIPLTDTSPDPVGRIDLSETSIGVSYAHHWRDRLAYGATAKWYRSDLGVAEASGPAFDAGVIYTPRVTVPLRFAVALRNLGPDLEFEESGDTVEEPDPDDPAEENLPARVRVGLGVQPDRFLGLPPNYAVHLLFDIESDLRELSTSSQHAGASLTINDAVMLRGGLVVLDNPFIEQGDGGRAVGGTFGVGIQYEGFQADVAREVSVSELGDETHFAVGWRF